MWVTGIVTKQNTAIVKLTLDFCACVGFVVAFCFGATNYLLCGPSEMDNSIKALVADV